MSSASIIVWTKMNMPCKWLDTSTVRLTFFKPIVQPKETYVHLVPFSENGPLPFMDAQVHHGMSESKKHSQGAFSFCHNFPDDPASKMGKMYNSEMAECSQWFSTGLCSQAEGPSTWPVAESWLWWWWTSILHIVDNHLYSVKVLQVNYTTYDVHHGQDLFNPQTQHCNIMVRSHKDDLDAHPYWYTCILCIFHAQVLHTDPTARNCSVQNMQFL